jgi:holliday junction DNA helicase RuvA
MIAFLSGIPKVIDNQVIMLVSGVGYGVDVPLKTRSILSTANTAELYIYTHVREDKLELFGFSTIEEKKLFIMLVSISGVGPKTALAIVDSGSTAISKAVQEANVKLFTAIPRVGKKLAQKIIIELTPKLGSIKELELTPLTALQSDLAEALQSLGFESAYIVEIVRDSQLQDMELEQALQYCLKQLNTT